MRGLASAWVLTALGLAVGGCGDDTGTLKHDAALAADTYLALDLERGVIEPVGASVSTDEVRFRTTHVLFRRISAGSGQTGTDGDLSQASEGTITDVSYRQFFFAVFELTQAQWERLTGTAPWTSTIYTGAFSDLSQATGDTLPAWGMSYDQAASAAASVTPAGWRVALPTTVQWEIAARAGNLRSPFPWSGRVTDLPLARTYAVFSEIAATAPLPRAVGGDRRANAWGIFDTVGNIGEFATPASGGLADVCGGAYDQPLIVCRLSNILPVERDLGHPAFGVRLVLVRQ